MRLKEKVAIITGGGGGIGLEICRGFIREGATVVIGDSDADRVDKVAREFKDAGHKGFCLVVDITKKSEVDGMVEKVMKEFGKIDILVHTAAIFPSTPFLDVSEEEWVKVIDVDLIGTFRCNQAVAREMVKKRSGKIINYSSGQGLMGLALMSHYSAAKGGVIALTRCLAAELSPMGINVNCIAPGVVETENVLGGLPLEFLNAISERVAVRRIGKPEELVGMTILLASDEASFVTGVTIPVDGGFANVPPPASADLSPK